tara:strand:- start:1224 stop:1379 length:156 start_codon:yes stop_codon:yes gene_type:complete
MSRQQATTLTEDEMIRRVIILQHHKHGLEWSDLLDLLLCSHYLNISLEGEE